MAPNPVATTILALRGRQQNLLCDALSAVRPNAPTLCEGWRAHDIAIHLWKMRHDRIGWLGELPGFGWWRRQRSDRVRRALSYEALIAELREPPGDLPCMPLDGLLESHRHSLGEYYVHTEDIARANRLVGPTPEPALHNALWHRAQTAARDLRPMHGGGLVLQRPDGERAVIVSGPGEVVVGEPSELLLWVYGRREVARVEVREA